MPAFRVVPADESHFEAHLHEMGISQEEVLSLITTELERHPRQGELRLAVKCPRIVGTGGLKRIFPWNRRSYWAPRRGRTIPSHLIVARRKPTRFLCFWGEWVNPETFRLTTYYPGKPAPREIHDPEISMEELSVAVRFWSRHAIIV